MASERRAALRVAAFACAVAAMGLPIVARLVSGPPGARVHIRWQQSLDTLARQRLEARFRLMDGEHFDGLTWRYDLVDPSRDNIRDLVRDPAVEDTQHIDRSRLVPDDTERTARRGRVAYGSVLVTAADRMALALAAIVVLLAQWQRISALILRSEVRLQPYAVLTMLGVAAYAVALWFPPTNGDDLSYLSSVATITNPLSYFIQDAGAGGNVYRPLLPVGMWIIYQMFGVWALPNQIINLVLHMTNVFLLYRIVQREQADKVFALLLAAVFMISKYTFVAATWTSDRPMVLTGLCLLLLINHLSQHGERPGNTSAATVRTSSVAAFSVLALMSKESGVVIPAVGLLFALVLGGAAHLTPRRRLSLVAVTASIIGLYIVFRVLIFGPGFASYSQEGYMFFGLLEYRDTHDLPRLLLYLNYAENVFKNALAPVLPVFGERGSLLTWHSFLIYMPVTVSTVLLFGLAVRRYPSRLQWIALMIMLVNAVAHFALFRSRLQYLSHAAFCLFVAGSPLFGNSDDVGRRNLLAVAKTLTVIVLAGGILWSSYALNQGMADRLRGFDTLRTEGIRRYGHVAEEVLQRYR
jgi:hypothetical protein